MMRKTAEAVILNIDKVVFNLTNKMNIRFLFAAVVLAAMTFACQRMNLPVEETGKTQDEEKFTFKISLSCELLDTETEEVSRSRHDVSALRKISNVNYYLFSGGSLVNQEYFEDAGDFAVTLPSYGERYNLYILANVGRKSVRDDILEVDMASEVHQDYGSHDNYFRTIGACGFPMSLIVNGFSVPETKELKLRRLVHTLYVKADTQALNTTEMEFTGLAVRNAARDVYPFAEESRAEYFIDGDAADFGKEELAALNNGEVVTLYLLENMRGELFAGNTDWKMKVPANMNPVTERDCASYIELTGSAKTATAYYAHNTYRAYIGSSASDCDVRRNAYSTLNNRFTNDMIVDEDWRIEGDTPVVTETLAFVDKYDYSSGDEVVELDNVRLYPGFVREFYVYRSNPDIEYTITGPDKAAAPYLSYTVSDVNSHTRRIRVTTDAAWNDNGSRTAVGRFLVRSEDGLISRTLDCAVLVDPLTAAFSYGPNTDASGFYPANEPKLRMSMNNVLNLGFDVEITGKAGAYIFYYPNGKWGKKQEETFDREFETGTLERIYPDPGQAVAIDEYLICTTVRNVPDNGLYDFFANDIWAFTREDSRNSIGSANSYDKRFQPTYLQFDIGLVFGPSKDGLLYPESPSVTLPVKVTNDDSTVSSGNLLVYNSGTDFGIYWNQIDDSGSGEIRRIEYTKPYASEKEAGCIEVTVNGVGKWSLGVNLPQLP